MRMLQYRLLAVLLVLTFLLPIPAAQAVPAAAAPQVAENRISSLSEPVDSVITSLPDPLRDFHEHPDQNPEPIRREFIPPTPEQLALTKAIVAEFDCSTVTDVPLIECQALVALYNSTNGAGWTINNWLTGTLVESWFGVVVSGGYVTELTLCYNQLIGSIPTELGSLTNLNTLKLSDNQLTGSIPTELGSLTNLVELDLDYNQLTGSIPSALGSLTNLYRLDLASNQLTGSIPTELGSLTKMSYLYLDNNQLTGSIPSTLSSLTNLYWLDLASNQLTGSIPSTLGSLTILHWLDLASNQLTGSIPSTLGSLTNLHYLFLDNNQLLGPIPSRLGSLTNLHYLILSNNQLSGAIPLSFVNLTNLVKFYFYYTSLCEPNTPEFLAWKESISDYQGTGRLCPPPTGYQQKYLFVPLNWTGNQFGFETAATSQLDIFIDEIPLSGCRDQVLVDFLDVESENFATFSCTDNPLIDIRNFVTDQTDYDPDDYDVVIGLTRASPCPPKEGQSNGANTIWVTNSSSIITAHELGHIFGLEDQYCSNQAGSNDTRCNDGDIQNDGPLTGDISWLTSTLPFNCPPDGSDDSTGAKCCNYNITHLCSIVDYGACCRGNFNSSGGRSTMSFSDAPGPRGFDDIELDYLGNLPELKCKSSSILSGGVTPLTDSLGNTRILDINLVVHEDDLVESGKITIDSGRSTQEAVLNGLSGDYQLSILDKEGSEIFLQPFSLYFDYSGPVFEDVDYSSIIYTEQDFSLRLPYSCAMNTLVLYHAGEIIFSQELPTVCDIFIPILRK